MKKIILIITLYLISLPQAWAGFAHYGTYSATVNANTSFTHTLSQTPVAGDLLVVCVIEEYGTVPSVKDSNNNTFSVLGSFQSSDNYTATSCNYEIVPLGITTSLTISAPGANATSMAMEYKVTGGTVSADTNAEDDAGAQTTPYAWSTNSVTTIAGDLLVGSIGGYYSVTTSTNIAGSGYTNIACKNDNGGGISGALCMEDNLSGSGGSTVANGTFNDSAGGEHLSGLLAAFKFTPSIGSILNNAKINDATIN